MLERIVPHLAMIGIHKNGTWAAQKVIECSVTHEERDLICSHLRPFAPPLMCDSLGNYVCAGTLRFGSPWSDYVFDAMMDRMWDIAQNRFGARCMRSCLESPYVSLYQKVSNRPRSLLTVETDRYWRHSQLDPIGDKPKWSIASDLVGGPIESARKIWSFGWQICFPYRALVYSQTGLFDGSAK